MFLQRHGVINVLLEFWFTHLSKKNITRLLWDVASILISGDRPQSQMTSRHVTSTSELENENYFILPKTVAFKTRVTEHILMVIAFKIHFPL